jgi:hypothetical protein
MTATRILPLSRIHNNGPGGHVPDALPVLIERHDHDPNREVEKTVYEHEQVSNCPVFSCMFIIGVLPKLKI